MKYLKNALSIGHIFTSHQICLKRARSCFCIFLLMPGLISGMTSSASAVDFIAGARGGYFVWHPYLQEIGEQFKDMKKGDGVLYGPVFSAMFTHDLSFSVSGLFGQQSADWLSENFYQSDPDKLKTGNYSFKVIRADIDSALNYRLTDNFKLFGGYKYQYLKIQHKAVLYERESDNTINASVEKNEIKMPYNGPAIGLGFSTFFGEKFFITSNLSLLYMWGKMDMYSSGYSYDSGNPMPKPIGGDVKGLKIQTRGINLEPSIGASLGEGLPIVTLGLRFQWTQVHFVNPPQEMEIKKDWANDYLYGIFITVLYPF